jgi:Mg-chelatase subunit ChlD/molecular chaperone GrpE (heat shock protein)
LAGNRRCRGNDDDLEERVDVGDIMIGKDLNESEDNRPVEADETRGPSANSPGRVVEKPRRDSPKDMDECNPTGVSVEDSKSSSSRTNAGPAEPYRQAVSEAQYHGPSPNDIDSGIKPRWIVFALDVSCSMEGDKLEYAKSALVDEARRHIDAGEGRCKIGIVSFSTAAGNVCEPTSEIDTITKFVQSLHAAGSTAMDEGISMALELMSAAPADVDRDIVLLTDGMPDGSRIASTRDAAATVKARGIRLAVLGIGHADVDENYLKSLVSNAEMVAGAAEIGEGFSTILAREDEAPLQDRSEDAVEMVARDSTTTEEAALERLPEEIHGLREYVDQRFHALEESIADLSRQISFIPAQVRGLSRDISDITTSVAKGRCRSLLLDLLGLYDLVDQLDRLRSDDSRLCEGDQQSHNYEVLRTQILQLLDVNGLSQIPCDGPFNPELQRAVRRVRCDSAEKDGWICRVVRIGFRTERSILRFAEVEVFYYDRSGQRAAPTKSPEDRDTMKTTPSEQGKSDTTDPSKDDARKKRPRDRHEDV